MGRCHIHFWQAIGNKVGSSLVEPDKISDATDAIKKAKELGVKLKEVYRACRDFKF